MHSIVGLLAEKCAHAMETVLHYILDTFTHSQFRFFNEMAYYSKYGVIWDSPSVAWQLLQAKK